MNTLAGYSLIDRVTCAKSLDRHTWCLIALCLFCLVILFFEPAGGYGKVLYTHEEFATVALVSRGMVIPAIAEAKSYRSFIEQVDQRLKPGDELYLFGEFFNSDSVVFYHRGPIETIHQLPQALATKIGSGNNYVIMAKRGWEEIRRYDQSLPGPVLSSMSTGPEGDAPLVLIQMRG